MKLYSFLASYWRISPFVRILSMITLIILLFGGVIHLIEPTTYQTWFDGIWWALITTATIGYGDLVPHTLLGKIAAMALILLGTGFVSAYFITLSAKTVSRENALSIGELPYTKSGHIVLIGWNERVRELLKQISVIDPEKPCVIIDETLKRWEVPKHVHFIKGNPTHDDVLRKANIHEAQSVIITANQHKNETEADLSSIVTLLTIKALNPSIYAVIEILTAQQVENAKRAGTNEIVRTNTLTSFMLINSLKTPRVVFSLETLLNQQEGNRFSFLQADEQLVGKSFDEALCFLRSRKMLLMGIMRGEEILFNPSPQCVIKEGDQLFVLVNESLF
jgi:voltage-gated potassium channel